MSVGRAIPAVIVALVVVLGTAANAATSDTVEPRLTAAQSSGRTVDGATVDPETIDATVQGVLSGSAYAGQRQGLLGLVANNPITRFVTEQWNRFIDWLNSIFDGDESAPPGQTNSRDEGRSAFAIPLLIGVALIVALLAAVLARRRTRAEESEYAADPHAELDSEQLISEADLAASSGDHELSVRLRFQSGLLTLDRRGIISYDEADPLGKVRRAVDQPEFEAVANDFERVTYSDHEADSSDSASAKTGWSRLLNRGGTDR